jgi:hypothetical protein
MYTQFCSFALYWNSIITSAKFKRFNFFICSQVTLTYLPYGTTAHAEPCNLYWGFLITHIQTHGRTPLDEWSARRRGLYLHRTTQHINISDKHPCPQRDSNPRSQQPTARSTRGLWNQVIHIFLKFWLQVDQCSYLHTLHPSLVYRVPWMNAVKWNLRMQKRS